MFGTNASAPGPSLPEWFLFPAVALFAVATIYWIARTRGRAARFLLFACYVRYTLGALHEYTYREALFGLRWVAIGSVLLISIGLVVLDKRRIFSKPFVPVALIFGLMIVSAIVNVEMTEAVDPLMRFVFFVIIAVSLWQALETHGGAVLRRLLFVFVQPLVFLAASVALDLPKSGELDGSLSYIGGYLHEELFSLILITVFLVTVLAKGLNPVARGALLVTTLVGLGLADYRTTIIAAIPLGAVYAITAAPRAFKPGQRKFITITIGAIACATFIAGVSLSQNRFSDLSEVTHLGDLVKPPERYSFADQRILSSRPYIWSQYISAYIEAPMKQKIIGFGPDSWVGRFPLYAHNTVISFLYELGVLGVAALLWLWFSMAWLAFRAERHERPILIAGHFSFLLLNMTTMPHWQLEGNIFYGILCGYTIAKARVRVRLGQRGIESWKLVHRLA